jgi:purine-nucleoside phosphorylase
MLSKTPGKIIKEKKKKMDAYRIAINLATNSIQYRLENAAAFGFQPKVGIVLGSGLGPLAKDKELEKILEIPYGEISNFPLTTVEGHAGTLIMGYMRDTPVAILNGRAHFYEYADEAPGEAMKHITLPTRVLKNLGIETLFVSNASGGLNRKFQVADLMIMDSYVNRMGANPLTGMNDDKLGTRFPPMSEVCDAECKKILRLVATDERVNLYEGTYVAMSGPNYEFSAEVRELRKIGDAVGMSSIPEIMVAKHGNWEPKTNLDRIIRTIGVSCITNIVDPDGTNATDHEEVIAAGKKAEKNFCALGKGFLEKYH